MMISFLFHQSKFISFLFFLFLIKTLNAQLTYLARYCYESGNYTANSLYKSNLDSLISALRSRSSGRGYYSYALGSSLTTTVYGNYLCRGDVSSLTCETCISTASRNALIACPVQKEVIIWYEECLLRYSNLPFFSIFDYGPIIRKLKSNVELYSAHIPYFFNTLEYRMDRLIREAYSRSSYFAEETHRVSYLGKVYDLYGLVQCILDLDPYDCYRCLKWSYNETEEFPHGNRFALVYSTHCMLTYKVNFLASSPPPPSPLTSPDSDDSFPFKLKGKVFRKIIGPVIAAVVMILVICVCSLCCYCFKKKKKQEEVEEREISTTNIVESPTDDQPIPKTESQLPN